MRPSQRARKDAVKYWKSATIAAVVTLVSGANYWLMAGTWSPQAPTEVKTALLRTPGNEVRREANLPNILSRRDAAFYRSVFTLQKEGRWNNADSLIGRINDPLLMGHVRFQRYMHPTKYRSSYHELRAWMEDYADHPGARRIYKLAKRRQPKGWKPPRHPARAVLVSEVETDPFPVVSRPHPNGRRTAAGSSRTERPEVREIQRRIRTWVASGHVTRSYRFLDQPHHVRLMGAVSFDESLTRIAAGYFFWNEDRKALKTASRAVARSGHRVPLGYWWGGLAAWRLGEYHEAARRFRALAESKSATPWLVSAGAYWASRAYRASDKPQRVEPMLRVASRYPRTFYGLLAITALGRRPPLDFGLRRLSAVDIEILLRMQPVRRALALIQVGEHVRAGSELRRFAHRLSPRLAQVMLVLASESGLADLSYSTAESLRQRTGVPVDAALYPLPVWEPDGGYIIDRAFLFAVMRQESNFRAGAKSPRGARGLMQLMPGTASEMAGQRYRGAGRQELLDPVLNVTLGQKYLQHLLSQDGIDGNLFYALSAYNSGPGRLRKWRREVDYRGDPLLFIESIPVRETRIFIERVLTNLWIYRARLGQPARSLETIVSGGWPSYVPLDRRRAASGIY